MVPSSLAWPSVAKLAQLVSHVTPADARRSSNNLQNAIEHALPARSPDGDQMGSERLQQRLVVGQHSPNRPNHRVDLGPHAQEMIEFAFQLGSCVVAETHRADD